MLLLSSLPCLLYPLSPLCPLCPWSSLSSDGMSLKVLRKRPVSATYLNNACSTFGMVSSFVMLMSLPPVLLCSVCLAVQCTGQCIRKCCMVSSACWHAGQMGESLFPMQCRCLASGACPVQSCVRTLVSFLGRLVMSLIYLFEVAVGSVFFIFVYCSDFLPDLLSSAFELFIVCCLHCGFAVW